MTMYEKRPRAGATCRGTGTTSSCRCWRRWDGGELAAAIEAGYRRLPATWDEGTEDEDLHDAPRHLPPQEGRGRRSCRHQAHGGGDPRQPEEPHLPPARLRPGLPAATATTTSSSAPTRVPELEALMRQAMVLHNQYRWDRGQDPADRGGPAARRRLRGGLPPARATRCCSSSAGSRGCIADPAAEAARRPKSRAAGAPVSRRCEVRERFTVMPRLEALAVYKGERAVHQRRPHPQRRLLLVAHDGGGDPREDRASSSGCTPSWTSTTWRFSPPERALEKSGRGPRRSGRCSSAPAPASKMMPSLATWLSGQLGMLPDPRLRATSWPPARACPTAWPRRCGCSRRWSGRSWWCAGRSSPTRSARCARRG